MNPNPIHVDPTAKILVTCPACKMKSRVPFNVGTIEVTCPQCKNKFTCNTGAKPTGYTPNTEAKKTAGYTPNTEAKKTGYTTNTGAKTAGHTPNAGEVPPNELLPCRKGGSLWIDPLTEPTTSHEAGRNLVAVMSGAQLAVFFDGETTRDFLKEYGGSLRCVTLSYTDREVLFTLYLANTPKSEHCLRYTYPEYTQYDDVTYFNKQDQSWMYRMAYSNLTKSMPGAYMHNGRIYKDVDQYRLYK